MPLLLIVRSGVRTHAHFRVPELKSGALDRSAILTMHISSIKSLFQYIVKVYVFDDLLLGGLQSNII